MFIHIVLHELQKLCVAEKVKNEGVQLVTLNSDDVAVELLIRSVNPQISEQYFITPDGRIVTGASAHHVIEWFSLGP